MKTCNKYNKLWPDFIAGELNEVRRQELYRHARTCPDCAQILQTHQQLGETDSNYAIPDEKAFLGMRRNVLAQIRANNAIRSEQPGLVIIRRLFALLSEPQVAYALALLLLVAGFMIGQRRSGSAEDSIVRLIGYSAVENTNLQQAQNSPYVYSNIDFEEAGAGQIRLDFDVATHLKLTRSKNDPLVKEIVTQALISGEAVGNRLKSITYSQEIIDPKIKEALLFAMLNDRNIAVRMKALESLGGYQADAQIRDAFLTALEKEQVVQMRILAIDYLMQNNLVDKKIEGQLLEKGNFKNTPLLRRMAESSLK
jgi:hypothetical protein